MKLATENLEIMEEQISSRESIRPRKLGSEFRYEQEIPLKIKQQRLGQKATNGSRKHRNLFEERETKQTIAKKRHARRRAQQKKFNEIVDEFLNAYDGIDVDIN